ncbi:MAG TPA: hypothetical protein VFT35_14345 [Gaiellaceae bacterium]|nr:hypothetical protein [Gaiellaceae bacterium]
MKRFSKRTWVAIVAVLAIAMSAIGAFAYFTAAGSGSGNATVGAATGVVITSDVNGTDLYPGGGDESVDVHVNNPGSGQQFVNDVSGTVADNGGCLGSWFQVDTIDLNANIAPGDTVDTTTALRMNDDGTNQDACQNKSLTINWTSN